jgi:hypothetical protein
MFTYWVFSLCRVGTGVGPADTGGAEELLLFVGKGAGCGIAFCLRGRILLLESGAVIWEASGEMMAASGAIVVEVSIGFGVAGGWLSLDTIDCRRLGIDGLFGASRSIRNLSRSLRTISIDDTGQSFVSASDPG